MSVSRFGRAVGKYLQQVIDLRPVSRQKMFDFSDPAAMAQWEVFTDRTLGLGGTSTAQLARCPDYEDAVRFSGTLSKERVADGGPKGLRDGVAEEYFDLEHFDRLRLRLRLHDDARFIFNIRTDNWVTGDELNFDVYQAHIPARPKADWQEVDILLDDFTLTWRGRLTESSVQFNPAAVTRMGISVAGGPIQQGEFALDVAWIEGRRGAAGDGVDDDML